MSNEPVLINRRFFLLAAAATAATLAVPMVPANELVRLPSPHPYLKRKIYDMLVGFELPIDSEGRALLASDGAVTISLRRLGGSHALHSMGINIRASYRWCVWDPVDMLVSLPASPINVAIDYSRPELSKIPVTIDMCCLDKVDEGPDVDLIERWRIVDNVYDPPVLNYMHPDNSLKARVDRERFHDRALENQLAIASQSFLSKVRRYIAGV